MGQFWDVLRISSSGQPLTVAVALVKQSLSTPIQSRKMYVVLALDDQLSATNGLLRKKKPRTERGFRLILTLNSDYLSAPSQSKSSKTDAQKR